MRWNKDICGIVDTGYMGIKKLHSSSRIPIKRSIKKPLTKDHKLLNRNIASERALNENVIGNLKRFKILSDRYRNRRKRFGLRFNLIAGIHNLEMEKNDGNSREGEKCCLRS